MGVVHVNTTTASSTFVFGPPRNRPCPPRDRRLSHHSLSRKDGIFKYYPVPDAGSANAALAIGRKLIRHARRICEIRLKSHSGRIHPIPDPILIVRLPIRRRVGALRTSQSDTLFKLAF